MLFDVFSAVMPREGGTSSTPRLLDSSRGVSGILDRPVEPGDDTEVVFGSEDRCDHNLDCFAEPVIGPRLSVDPLARNDEEMAV